MPNKMVERTRAQSIYMRRRFRFPHQVRNRANRTRDKSRVLPSQQSTRQRSCSANRGTAETAGPIRYRDRFWQARRRTNHPKDPLNNYHGVAVHIAGWLSQTACPVSPHDRALARLRLSMFAIGVPARCLFL